MNSCGLLPIALNSSGFNLVLCSVSMFISRSVSIELYTFVKMLINFRLGSGVYSQAVHLFYRTDVSLLIE